MIAKANAEPEPKQEPEQKPESAPIQNADATHYFLPEELAPVTPVPPPQFPREEAEPEVSVSADLKAAAIAALKKPAQPAPAPAPEVTQTAPIVEQPAATPAHAIPSTVEPAPVLEQVAPNEKDPMRSPLGLRYFVPAEQWQKDTRVSELTLNENMMQQAGLRAFYGVQAAMAEQQHSKLKQRLELTEAQLNDTYRRAFVTAGEKVTEKMIEAAIHKDATYQKVKNLVIEAESIVNQNKAIVAAMGDRKDMLVQLGADRRNEMQGQLRVMEQQARDNAFNDLKETAKSAIRGH
jgi:hypothetical protein